MQNIDTTLTDFFIAAICMYFVLRLWRISAVEHDMRGAFVGLFFSIALAGLAGGITHGWYEHRPDILAAQFWWKLTLMAIGLSAFYVYVLIMYELGVVTTRTPLEWALRIGFLFYFYVVGFVRADFAVAVYAYLPAITLWFFVFVWLFVRTKSAQYLIALVGLLISFAAIGVQTSRYTIHPDYLDHNALYHLVQSIGLYLIYRFAQGRVQ